MCKKVIIFLMLPFIAYLNVSKGSYLKSSHHKKNMLILRYLELKQLIWWLFSVILNHYVSWCMHKRTTMLILYQYFSIKLIEVEELLSGLSTDFACREPNVRSSTPSTPNVYSLIHNTSSTIQHDLLNIA